MELLPLDQAPAGSAATVFRESQRGVFIFTVCMWAVAGFTAHTALGSAPAWYWLVPLAASSCAVPGSLLFCASLSEANWVVKHTPQGVFVNLRSYLHPHGAETVLFIGADEVDGIRPTLVERKAGQPAHVERCACLDFQLLHEETQDLRIHLHAEEALRPDEVSGLEARRYHVPVELPTPNVIRITWRSEDTWLRPGPRRALAFFSRTWPAQGLFGERVVGHDLFTEAELEAHLVQLAQDDDESEAFRLLRLRRGMTLDEARSYLAGLVERKPYAAL